MFIMPPFFIIFAADGALPLDAGRFALKRAREELLLCAPRAAPGKAPVRYAGNIDMLQQRATALLFLRRLCRQHYFVILRYARCAMILFRYDYTSESEAVYARHTIRAFFIQSELLRYFGLRFQLIQKAAPPVRCFHIFAHPADIAD